MNSFDIDLRWVRIADFGGTLPAELRGWRFPAVYRWAVYDKKSELVLVYFGETYHVVNRFSDYPSALATAHRKRSTRREKTEVRVSRRLKEERKKGNTVKFERLDFAPFVINRLQIHPKGLGDWARRKFMENLALLDQDRTRCEVLNFNPDFFAAASLPTRRMLSQLGLPETGPLGEDGWRKVLQSERQDTGSGARKGRAGLQPRRSETKE